MEDKFTKDTEENNKKVSTEYKERFANEKQIYLLEKS